MWSHFSLSIIKLFILLVVLFLLGAHDHVVYADYCAGNGRSTATNFDCMGGEKIGQCCEPGAKWYCTGTQSNDPSCGSMGYASCIASRPTKTAACISGSKPATTSPIICVGCRWVVTSDPPPPPGTYDPPPPKPTVPACVPSDPGEATPSCAVSTTARAFTLSISGPPGYDYANRGYYVWSDSVSCPSGIYYQQSIVFNNIPVGEICRFEIGTFGPCGDFYHISGWTPADFLPQTDCEMEDRPVCTMDLLSPSVVVPGTNNVFLQLTAQSYSYPNGMQQTHTYLERADGAQITPPAGTSYAGSVSGHHFYKIDGLTVNSDGTGWPPSASEQLTLPLGNYYVHCDEPNGGYICSGNPYCSYEGETPEVPVGLVEDCSAYGPYASCGAGDNDYVRVVTPTPTTVPTNTPTKTPTKTPTRTPTQTPTPYINAELRNQAGSLITATNFARYCAGTFDNSVSNISVYSIGAVCTAPKGAGVDPPGTFPTVYATPNPTGGSGGWSGSRYYYAWPA